MQKMTNDELRNYLSTVRGATFVERFEVDDSSIMVKYFDDYNSYTAARPESRITHDDYNNYFSTGDAIRKLLIREPVGILRKYPALDHVTMVLPFDGKTYTVDMERSEVETYLGTLLQDLVDENSWITRFIDPVVYDPQSRAKAADRFITVS